MGEINLKIKNYELLSRKVYKALKYAIIQDKIKPGSRLSELKIAKQMGISRTPVREAIHKLSSEGFVELLPNQGITISKISVKDLEEVLNIRSVLDGLAARLAARKIKSKDINKLETIIEEMKAKSAEKNIPRYIDLSSQFQGIILKLTGNKRLEKIRSNLNDLSFRFSAQSLEVPGRFDISIQEHEQILEALKKGDEENAYKSSEIHVQNVLKNIINHSRDLKNRKTR